MSSGRFVLFLTIVLSVWTIMHLYVFWRLSSVPWLVSLAARRALVPVAVLLWASYPLARVAEAHGFPTLARPLEWVGANWIGVLFLLLSAILAADAITLGGRLWPRMAPALPGWAALVALLLSVVGFVQGLRPPVVRDYEVELAGLPPERDGLVLVAISDLHLGTLIGRGWTQHLVQRVNDLHPDLVVLVGDILEGDDGQVENEIVPALKALQAPLGVWAVLGNHEYYNGINRSVDLLEAAGCTVLRDRWAEAGPGLVLAGVDDLTARSQFGQGDQSVAQALAGRPRGATILLSHTPWQVDTAAKAGAGLMISGHTHNGQIWPFNYLVKLRYPMLGGLHHASGMPAIVCRGTGTWGPRMRLWRPGEIVRIRLSPGFSRGEPLERTAPDRRGTTAKALTVA